MGLRDYTDLPTGALVDCANEILALHTEESDGFLLDLYADLRQEISRRLRPVAA